jgi:hypothetical protein
VLVCYKGARGTLRSFCNKQQWPQETSKIPVLLYVLRNTELLVVRGGDRTVAARVSRPAAWMQITDAHLLLRGPGDVSSPPHDQTEVRWVAPLLAEKHTPATPPLQLR